MRLLMSGRGGEAGDEDRTLRFRHDVLEGRSAYGRKSMSLFGCFSSNRTLFLDRKGISRNSIRHHPPNLSFGSMNSNKLLLLPFCISHLSIIAISITYISFPPRSSQIPHTPSY
jgi:hypothetical protein